MTTTPYRLWYLSGGMWGLFATYPDAATAKRMGPGLAHPWRHQPASWLPPAGGALKLILSGGAKPAFEFDSHALRWPKRNGDDRGNVPQSER
jgi:hypothetical protein